MELTELVVLLPCHSLEDFPTYHTGDSAEGLLAAWSALWHPHLIAVAGKSPSWQRADDPPAPAAGMLIVVPTVVEHELPSDYVQQAADAGAVVVHGLHRRKDILEKALVAFRDEPAPGTSRSQPFPSLQSPVSSLPLAIDFHALGLAYLLTELLTRRMRYMSNLDEKLFKDTVVAAATAAVADDEVTAREHIARCCELLYESRAHYYPVDTYLLDLTLVAPTTLGESLRRELAGTLPINLLASGEIVKAMATQEPASLAAVRERLDAKTLAIIGGEYHEAELSFLSLEAILAELEAGRHAYRIHLGVRPDVFGRRRAGLTPALPQILRGLGFKGALHFTLDDGRFPQADRSKTLWEGTSATAIDAVGRVPLDAGAAASILSLPEKLGESMDHDFVSMIALAHWPEGASEYFEDLRRISKYSPVLGKFVTVDEFFANTESAGSFSKFKLDEYRTPYLTQAVQTGAADPISTFVRGKREEQQREATATMSAWTSLLTGTKQERSIAVALGSSDRPAGPRGFLLVNPLSFPRRVAVDISGLEAPPDVEGAVVAIDSAETPALAVVDVPPHGFAWIGPGGGGKPGKRKPQKLIAKENTLVNELCEVTIHPETGGIRSIRDLHARGNRLSQQLALRLGDAMPMPVGLWRDPDEGARYSQMIADSIAVTANSNLLGEITSRGRLLNADGRELARFVQRARLASGRACVEIDIELETNDEPGPDPWSSYYGCRFAWSDDLAEIRRSVHGASFATEARRIESPDFVEIIAAKSRTAILTGGLPYHRRSGSRMLDTLLVVRGETARRFQLAITLEEPHALRAAVDFVAPAAILPGVFPPPAGARSGWLFHIDSRHVMATHWAPLTANDAVIGFRARLLEFGGQGGTVTLRTFRDVASAHRVTFDGDPAEELRVEGDRIDIEMSAHEWLQLEARWT